MIASKAKNNCNIYLNFVRAHELRILIQVGCWRLIGCRAQRSSVSEVERLDVLLLINFILCFGNIEQIFS